MMTLSVLVVSPLPESAYLSAAALVAQPIGAVGNISSPGRLKGRVLGNVHLAEARRSLSPRRKRGAPWKATTAGVVYLGNDKTAELKFADVLVVIVVASRGSVPKTHASDK